MFQQHCYFLIQFHYVRDDSISNLMVNVGPKSKIVNEYYSEIDNKTVFTILNKFAKS